MEKKSVSLILIKINFRWFGTKKEELAFDVDIVNSTIIESTLPNYQVTKKPGTFTITKRKLEVKTTFSGSIEYRPVLSEQDHASLEQYSFESGTTLAGKDAFSLTASYAKEDSMDLSYSYHITHEDGSDASDCYEVIPSTITNPNAKVEKRKIALHTKSETLVYDGKSHTLSKDALTYTGDLHEGDTFVTSDTDQNFTDANEKIIPSRFLTKSRIAIRKMSQSITISILPIMSELLRFRSDLFPSL